MSAIHDQQSEKHREDLSGNDAVEKIRQIVKSAKTCFFCTTASTENSSGARPMSVREVDDEGNLWFLSAVDSHQNRELAADASVRLYMQGSPHSEFLELDGRAEISRDKARIRQLWEPLIKTWFTEGVDDPRITVIKVTPTSGYYWDNKHGDAVAAVKMFIGSALGKRMDDGVEGEISV